MFCPNCGANVGDANFCSQCGYRLTGIKDAAPKTDDSQKKAKIDLHDLKGLAKKGFASIDMDSAKEKARKASEIVGAKAGEIKDSAMAMKDDITEKLTELDRMNSEGI